MNFIEALKTITNEPRLWMRPVHTWGSGVCYCVKRSRLVSLTHQASGLTSNLGALLGRWEVVTPVEALGEDDRLSPCDVKMLYPEML